MSPRLHSHALGTSPAASTNIGVDEREAEVLLATLDPLAAMAAPGHRPDLRTRGCGG
jgi:hypothetical protein